MSVRNAVKSIQNIMRQDVGVDGDAQRISQLCWMFFLKIIDDQDQELELTRDEYRSPIPKKLRWRTWAADPEGITGEELLAFINDDLFPGLKDLATSTRPGDRRRVVKDVFEDAYNYMKSGQLMRQVVNRVNEIDFNNLTERQHFGDIYEQILNDLQSAGNAGEYYTPRAVTAFMADRIDPRPGEVLLDPACGTGGFLTCALSHMRAAGRSHDAGCAARRGEEATTAHVVRNQYAVARHRGSELCPPRQHAGAALHQLHRFRARRHRSDQPAVRRS
jgi:type I restriction enzyme M protein